MKQNNFRQTELGEVIEFYNGKSIKPGGTGQYFVYGSNGIIGWNDEYTHENAIIIGRVGAYCGSIKYYHGKFWASDNTIVAKPRDTSNDIRYFSYLLHELKLNKYAGGAAQPLVTHTVLKRVPALVASLPIQKKIAAILSAYDDLIENNTRRINILEEMAQMIYREWFINFRFPGHEGVRMVESELGPVPKGWEVLPFSQALTLQRGFDLTSADRQEGSVPIYGSIGLSGYHNIVKVKAPGIVTGRSGTLGLVHYVERDFWPHNTALWVKEFKKVTPLFTLFLLRAMDLKQYNGGVAVPTLDRNVVHRVPVIIPERELIENFEEIVKPLFPLISNLEQKNANLRRTRDLLLPKLISGVLDVSELDIDIPTDL